MFQSFSFRNLVSWRKLKRVGPNITFRPQIAVSSIAELVVRVAESAMVQICRLRVCLLWALIRILAAWRVLARICRAWFSNYARIQEFGSRWKCYSTLVRVTSSLNFVGSWIFIKAWCVAIGSFLESKRIYMELKRNSVSLKGKFSTKKADFYKGIDPSALWSYPYDTTYIYQS